MEIRKFGQYRVTLDNNKIPTYSEYNQTFLGKIIKTPNGETVLRGIELSANRSLLGDKIQIVTYFPASIDQNCVVDSNELESLVGKEVLVNCAEADKNIVNIYQQDTSHYVTFTYWDGKDGEKGKITTKAFSLKVTS